TVAHGGCGTILKARQKSLGRIVAIKTVFTPQSFNQKEILRFRREAEAMALLSHDNIVSVFDYAYAGDSYYIVMEYIDGITFEKALDARIPTEVALFIIEKVIGCLRFAHREKIIHRDIKPQNILLGKQGQVKLADFGLATFGLEMTRHSSTSAVLGTFCYMAPEAMVNPKDVDARVDIFSIGCVLYRIFSGKLPFNGATIGEVSYKVLNEEPAAIAGQEKYAKIVSLVTLSMNKDREKRPGLEQLQAAIRDDLRAQYPTLPELLQEFIGTGVPGAGEAHPDGEAKNGSVSTTGRSVRQSQSDAPGVEPQVRAVSLRQVLSRFMARKRAVFLAIFIAVLTISAGVFFMVRRNSIGYQLRMQELPKLDVFKERQSFPSADEKRQPSKKVVDGSPKPLTSTTLYMNEGTLRIKGLTNADTILINTQRLSVGPGEGEKKMTLQSGHYSVTILGRSGSKLQRSVRIMPYQVFILNLDEERALHERDSEKQK
ncbi:MAG: serine/threonine protein kinase, partial [Chitinivibrionales bacterium]|nr:serine/threonine protein kinase [Chitinivibrionales bacterium]